jgi:hypothetical protein
MRSWGLGPCLERHHNRLTALIIARPGSKLILEALTIAVPGSGMPSSSVPVDCVAWQVP